MIALAVICFFEISEGCSNTGGGQRLSVSLRLNPRKVITPGPESKGRSALFVGQGETLSWGRRRPRRALPYVPEEMVTQTEDPARSPVDRRRSSGGTLPERKKEATLPSCVPRPPVGCTLCENAGFVGGVLGDLGAALDEARVYHGQIQKMSSRILTAHEEERKRIARELHDDTAQAITSILVRLRLLERSTEDAGVLKNVEELRELTSDALDSVRRVAMDLRPAALDDLGLLPALQSYAERFSHATPIAVRMEVEGLGKRLPRDVELVLYRVFQEALTNISKHASATTALVQVRRNGSEVTLVITDDGDGFDPGSLSPAQGSGLGLFGMRERLTLVGGVVEVESAKGKGTRIAARVPLAKRLRAGR